MSDFVLVVAGTLDGDAGGGEGSQAVLAERVAVADPQVDGDAERGGMPGAAVGGDDQPDVVVPARPRGIERVAVRSGAVGEDEGSHAGDASAPRAAGTSRRRENRPAAAGPTGAGADARLGAVPDPLDHPAIRRVIDAAARKGITLEVRVFDESTHTAAEAAAAVGAELGQIVKSLVFVASGDDGLEPVIALVSGPNRVDLARLAAVTGGREIRRATAREANELTGFVIGGIPPIGHLVPVRVVMDPDLGRYQVVWAAAGLPTAVFPVPPGTLRILANATVAPITETPADDDRGTETAPGA